MSLIGRLLVLFAVLLMPLGMAPAAAADHHVSMAGVSMGHCPDQPRGHQHNDGLATCSMPCASALPAQELMRDGIPDHCPQLVISVATRALHGIHLEIATPPPRPA